MRLLNTLTGRLEWFNDDDIPRYATLSHVWDKREQTFQDVEKLGHGSPVHAGTSSDSLVHGLSAKLYGACKFAADRGYDWIWVDTCCINKESSAELSEAINSMYKWYSNAEICIAYLVDVPDGSLDLRRPGSALWESRWFSRGWTLQELIAPKNVEFVSEGWRSLGMKADLARILEAITGVKKEVLTQARSLSTISIAERMSWAAKRKTTRVEDRAYSLLGIFGVYMSPLYGEGMHAFRRLQEELLRSSPDQTLFAWEFSRDSAQRPLGLFADSPSRFTKKGLEGLATLSIEEMPMAVQAFRSALSRSSSPAASQNGSNTTHPSIAYGTPVFSFTHYGIRARVPLISRPSGQGHSRYAIAILAAADKSGYVGLVLQRLLQAETIHYTAGTHWSRLIRVNADQTGEFDPCRWVEELDLAYDDAAIQWQDIYITTTTEPWHAQIRPAVADIPLKMLSGIPASDLNYFRSGRHHSFLTRRCLAVMNSSMRQDMCGIRDPSIRKEDLPLLQDRIAEGIPEELQHACKLWLTHLPLSSPDPGLLGALSTFANEHLFHWIEALSLLGSLWVGAERLPATYVWLSKHAPNDEQLFRDAGRTIQAFYDTISTSALQLYHSVLRFDMPDCNLYDRSVDASPSPVTLRSPRRRGWAWIPTKLWQECFISAVAFMPDNVHVVSGSTDGSLKMWNSQTLRGVSTFASHHIWVSAVACSPDGKFVASCGGDPGVPLWDVGTGDILRVLAGQHHAQRAVAFSADSAFVAAGSSDGSVHVWSAATGETVRAMRAQTASVRAIVFSPEGVGLASASEDGTIKIWNVATGGVVHTLRGTDWATSVAFSPHGSRIVSGCWDGTVGIWDAATGEMILELEGHTHAITFVAFAAHGSQVISTSRDGIVRKWDASTGERVSTLARSQGTMLCASISPDETRICFASGATIETWDAKAASTELARHQDTVSSVAFAPGGKTFATSSHDKTVRLWKTDTAEVLHVMPHASEVDVVRFSPDGTVLATGTDDPTITLFETSAWSEKGTLRRPSDEEESGRLWSLTFSPDGSRIAGGTATSVSVWDLTSREHISAFTVGHDVETIAFSPDMTRIATGLHVAHASTRVWDVATGRGVAELPGPGSRHHSIAFSPDGAHVVSRGHDGSVSVGGVPRYMMDKERPTGVDSEPLRFSWHADSGGEGSRGWLRFAPGGGGGSKPVLWVPEERRPGSNGKCYAWYGNVVVVGSESGVVTVIDVTEAIESL